MIRFAQTGIIAIETLVRGDDFPHIQTGAGDTGSPSGRSIGKNNPGAPSLFSGFGQQLIGNGGKVTARNLSFLLNGFCHIIWNSNAFLNARYGPLRILVHDIDYIDGQRSSSTRYAASGIYTLSRNGGKPAVFVDVKGSPLPRNWSNEDLLYWSL